MDNFLDRYKIAKWNQDARDHLNNPTTHKEIEAVIEILPNKQTNKTTTITNKKEQDQMVLGQNSIKHSKKTYHQYFSYYSTKYKQKEHYPTRSMMPKLWW